MSKQMESSLFIASSFSGYAAFYQQFLKGIETYEALTARILAQIKAAYVFRQTDSVRQLAGILANMPSRESRLIGQCYLAWCDCRNHKYQPALLEGIIEQSNIYKAHALISRGAIDFYRGKFDDALRFYLESLKARPTASEYALAIKGIAVIKSIEGFDAQALRDLSNLTPILRYTEPIAYFDCLNSYSVELIKAGRLDEASNITELVQATPFASAYPEWRETFSEVRSKRKRRSTVAISWQGIEQEHEDESEGSENIIDKARVRAVIEFMNANLERSIAVPDFADAVNLSTSHFSRLFKAETGLSPGEYLIRLRMETAGQLLATSFLSIKQIAGKVGCVNKSNFVRQFKRYFDIAPSEHRRRELVRVWNRDKKVHTKPNAARGAERH